MAFIEDLTPFFRSEEFADDDTLGGEPVVGIFDNAYAEQGMGPGASGSAPTYTLPSSAVPSPAEGVALVHGGVTYYVVEPMPDGTGVTILRLRT